METVGAPQVGEALRGTVDMVIAFGSDFFAFIVVAALVAAFAFYFGRDRLIPLVAGLLVAIPLYSYFPFAAQLGANPWLTAGLYLVLALAGLIAFSGLASWVPSSGVGFVKVLGLSAICAGVVLAVAINVLPIGELYTFSEPTRALFASSYVFWWLLAGLGGVLVLGK